MLIKAKFFTNDTYIGEFEMEDPPSMELFGCAILGYLRNKPLPKRIVSDENTMDNA